MPPTAVKNMFALKQPVIECRGDNVLLDEDNLYLGSLPVLRHLIGLGFICRLDIFYLLRTNINSVQYCFNIISRWIIVMFTYVDFFWSYRKTRYLQKQTMTAAIKRTIRTPRTDPATAAPAEMKRFKKWKLHLVRNKTEPGVIL